MSHVYVIAAEGGPVKVGIAGNPQARLAQLRTGTPFPLRLAHVEDTGDLDPRNVETFAHMLLNHARTHGEWFAVTVDDARRAVQSAIVELQRPPPDPGQIRSIFFDRSSRSEIIPAQYKMARAALGLTIHDLAKLAGVSHDTIVRIEAGGSLKANTHAKVRSALEAAGVEFIAENGGGAGVRLAKPVVEPRDD